MALNYFNEKTSRRLALGIFAVSGTLLLTAFNIVSNAIISDKSEYAALVAEAFRPLAYSALGSLVALIFIEVGAHEETPSDGHPHSKSNYLQSAFAMILTVGLGCLIYGAFKLTTSVSG